MHRRYHNRTTETEIRPKHAETSTSVQHASMRHKIRVRVWTLDRVKDHFGLIQGHDEVSHIEMPHNRRQNPAHLYLHVVRPVVPLEKHALPTRLLQRVGQADLVHGALGRGVVGQIQRRRVMGDWQDQNVVRHHPALRHGEVGLKKAAGSQVTAASKGGTSVLLNRGGQ